MADNAVHGCHRAPGRYNPLSEVRLLVSATARPALKGTAVLVASGGLLATLAIPAHAGSLPASTAREQSSSTAWEQSSSPVAPRPFIMAQAAVTAPLASAPRAHAGFGVMGYQVVAKPKPKPKPVVHRSNESASRSSSRASTSSSSTSSRVYESSHAAAGGVLAVARTLLGIYYVYGGSTPSGFDCSGFTSYVFRQVGISLPRTAAGQQAAATRVSSPQPGDLVFFGYPAYHVGIYAGGGMMYDSPTTGKTTGLHQIWSTNITFGRP